MALCAGDALQLQQALQRHRSNKKYHERMKAGKKSEKRQKNPHEEEEETKMFVISEKETTAVLYSKPPIPLTWFGPMFPSPNTLPLLLAFLHELLVASFYFQPFSFLLFVFSFYRLFV